MCGREGGRGMCGREGGTCVGGREGHVGNPACAEEG